MTSIHIVPIQQVMLHEGCERRRVVKLKRALHDDGVLKDPPVAMQHQDRYIILDGATRTQALVELGANNIAIQVVDFIEQEVRLESWHHVLLGLPRKQLQQLIQAATGLEGYVIELALLERKLRERSLACGLIGSDGSAYGFDATDSDRELIGNLNRVVDTYQGETEIHRVTCLHTARLREQYPSMSCVVVFPHFQREDIIRCGLFGPKLPTGITRHVLEHRLTGLDIPLEFLIHNRTQEQQNAWLDRLQLDWQLSSFISTRTEQA